MSIIELVRQPWPWYISGPWIAAVLVILLFFGKKFGFSSNLQTICAMAGAGKRVKFFDYNWRGDIWNLLFLIGAIGGGFISKQFLSSEQPVQISQATITDLQSLHFAAPTDLEPGELYDLNGLSNIKTVVLLLIGGLLIGFGTRWAGGCTSGHAITGLSQLQIPSLIAVIGFFIGGLLMTHLIFPFIF